jgi:hypothetical protein
MYDIIIHSIFQERSMKKQTEGEPKERLEEAVDALTEENQRHVLGVLEALVFAQAEQGGAGEKIDRPLNDASGPGGFTEEDRR